MNKRAIGSEGEAQAVQYLIQAGCSIIMTNFTCKIGEIDIIAKERDTVLFIEVKWRKNDKMGRPYEAVNYHKQKKVIKSAMLYAQQKQIYDKPMRFDVIEIIGEEILWLKNAFTLENNSKYL